MKYQTNLREEEIKNRLRHDSFDAYDATPILGNIDFAVALPALPLHGVAPAPEDRE